MLKGKEVNGKHYNLNEHEPMTEDQYLVQNHDLTCSSERSLSLPCITK